MSRIRTQLVGILNLTPDSFSDGGQFNQTAEQSPQRALSLMQDGADMIDIGAESTRPGAKRLTPEEELARILPLLNLSLERNVKLNFSLDTLNWQTVLAVHELGLNFIVNNVAGLSDPKMRKVVAELNLKVIISHLPFSAGGEPQTAHRSKLIDSVEQVLSELMEYTHQAISDGIDKANIILDPGIGFGKTPECNRKLLSFAELVPEYPVMIGYSRKRFLGEDRMEIEPNLEAGRVAISSGAAYLRVHDVAAHQKLLLNLS